MLKVMRDTFSRFKWALVAVVAAVVFGFVFIDLGLGGGAGGGGDDRPFAARVNGETITYNEYYRALKNVEEMYRQMYGQQFTAEMAAQIGLQQQVLQSLVDQRLLVQEAARLRLDATSEEVRRKLLSIPTFTQDGKFIGMELYTRYVTGPLGYPNAAAFEEDLSREIVLQKMESALQTSVIVSPTAADAEYRRTNESTTIRYIHLPAVQQPVAATIRPEEVESYYRANQANYAHGEQRNVRYLLADYARIRSQITPGEDELRRRYEANSESFRMPAAARVFHILVRVEPGAGPTVDAAARARAETLVQQLRAGADFMTLARANSDDPSSAQTGGDMGWVEMDQTVEPFERAIFSIPLSTISDPIRSDEYGYHIVRVPERRQAGVRTFDEVRADLAAQTADDMARDVAQAEINRLNALVRQNKPANVGAFTALANDKVTSNDGGWVARADNVEGLGNHPPLSQWLFEAKKGDVSAPIATSRGLALVYVADTRPAGIAPLAEVRQKVELDARLEKGREAARAALTQMMQGASTIDEIAAKSGQQPREVVVTRQGSVPGIQGESGQLVATAMDANVGELKGPITVGDGVVAFQVASQKKVTDEELAENRAAFIDSLRGQQFRNLRSVLLDRLRKNARIELNDDIMRPTTRPTGI
jgi:peptidyl-prolyl cis-trans isomerase D